MLDGYVDGLMERCDDQDVELGEMGSKRKAHRRCMESIMAELRELQLAKREWA